MVKKSGLSPFGISVGVADLKVAQRVVEKGIDRNFVLDQSENRMSFVVPAEFAGGTYLEFIQQYESLAKIKTSVTI